MIEYEEMAEGSPVMNQPNRLCSGKPVGIYYVL